jgi:hypothetical protein
MSLRFNEMYPPSTVEPSQLQPALGTSPVEDEQTLALVRINRFWSQLIGWTGVGLWLLHLAVIFAEIFLLTATGSWNPALPGFLSLNCCVTFPSLLVVLLPAICFVQCGRLARRLERERRLEELPNLLDALRLCWFCVTLLWSLLLVPLGIAVVAGLVNLWSGL